MELPRLEPLWKKYRDKGFTIIAVEGKRDRKRARALIAESALSYHFLENGEGDAEVARRVYGIVAYPSSFLVDRQGRVLFSHLGFEAGDEKELAAEIERLLGG